MFEKNLDSSSQDNDIESFYCGKNVEFDLCANSIEADCKGWDGLHGAGFARVGKMGWKENEVSSIRLQPYDDSK